MVIKDEINLALCAAPEINKDILFEPIYSEEVVLLAPTEHPLSKKKTIYLKDLSKEKLIITNALCPFRGNLERKMIESGIIPQYGMEVSNMLTLKYYVQSNLDRKSTRLNSSHVAISYAVFCLKKKKRRSVSGKSQRTGRPDRERRSRKIR